MMRTRAALLALAAGFLVGCQDSRLPTDAEPGKLTPLISDGAHINPSTNEFGNSHFFFLPPMVPDPDIPLTETFNLALTPQVFICEFNGEFVAGQLINEPSLDPTLAKPLFCADGGMIAGSSARAFGPFDAPRVEGKEHYIFHWQTVNDALLIENPDASGDEVFYRVFVVAAGEEVGFADVDVEGTQAELNLVNTDIFVPLFIDRTLPVKFFVGAGFVCEARGLDETECGDGFSDLTAGGIDRITVNNSGVDIPDQGIEFEVGAITVIVTPCPSSGNLPIDLPRFGTCFDIETFPELEGTLAFEATVFSCFGGGLAAIDGDLTSDDQLKLLTVHRQDEETGAIQALPHADAFCPTLAPVSSLPPGKGLLRYARAGWNALTGMAMSVFAPEALYAKRRRRGDEGPGGEAGEFSRFQIGLPTGESKVAATDNQVAAPGSDITVQVKLRDVNLGNVRGARVECGVTVGGGSVSPASGTPVKSGGDGISEFTWTLGAPGNQELECGGFGIGDAGPFMPPLVGVAGGPVTLATGTVTFKAFACNNFNISADGSLSEAEWGTASPHMFTANLAKGNSAPGTVKVMNDCDNLYVALTVERPEADDVNVLRVDFDNNGDGAPAEGDDVWKLEAIAGGSEVIDGFLTSRCFRGGKQAECFTADTDVEGINNLLDGVGAASHSYDEGSGLSVYEFKVALNSGDTSSDALPIDVALDNNDSKFGMFFTLSQSPSAKGAQGNTQWPGFRLYLQCTTKTPTASGSELSCVVPQEQ